MLEAISCHEAVAGREAVKGTVVLLTLNHTHHLAMLTWTDVAKLDATLLNGVRHLQRLPKSFPRVALQAPTAELGLNFPSIWEDYCAAAGSTWCRTLNDDGILG